MWLSLIDSAIRLTLPVLFVAIGELISQRSGVINIGLEGMMSAGAYAGYIVMVQTNNLMLACLAAILAGTAAATIMAGFSVWAGVNQILVGFAIFILVPGVTGFLNDEAGTSNVTALLPNIHIPLLSDIPLIGPPFFTQNAFYWMAVILSFLVWFLLTRTRFGLLISAAGHNPAIARAKGVPVKLVQTTAVLLCGAFAGLGGAALTVGALGAFSSTATDGRGFIAIAIVILGRWRLGGVIIAALAIGITDAIRIRLGGQVLLPVQFLAMGPWLVMLVMLIYGARAAQNGGPAQR